MLAHHPITNQPIRVLTTQSKICATEKTLILIEPSFIKSNRWSRWHCVINHPDAANICGYSAITAVVITDNFMEWSLLIPELLKYNNTFLVIASQSIINKLPIINDIAIAIENINDNYPFIDKIDNISDVLNIFISIAHILRMNRAYVALKYNNGAKSFINNWQNQCCNRDSLFYIDNFANDSYIPQTWLIQQFFKHSNYRRNKEIIQCLIDNINCDYIDNILLLNETDIPDIPKSDKIKLYNIEKRLTYYDTFIAVQKYIPKNSFVIIANSDIVFDETLNNLWKIPMNDAIFLALLRWEDNDTIYGPRPDSQDVWIVSRDQLVSMIESDTKLDEFNFNFGKPGCDNVIALLMMKRRFLVANPAYSIRTLHRHKSQIRDYNNKDILYYPQYLHIEPSYIQPFEIIEHMKDAKYMPIKKIIDVWNSNKLSASFPRFINCADNSLLSTICKMMPDDWNYIPHSDNLWTPSPQMAPLYYFKNSFVTSSGLISDFRNIYIGKYDNWRAGWSDAKQSSLMPSVYVPSLIAYHFDDSYNSQFSKWVLYYLSRVLTIRECVGVGTAKPEFIIPSSPDAHDFIKSCIWSDHITCVQYTSPDVNYYASHVWAVPYIDDNIKITSEDIERLRNLLPKIASSTECKIVICINDLITNELADAIRQNIFETIPGMSAIKIVTVENSDNFAMKYEKFANASWIIGIGDILDWLWLAPKNATVMEFMYDIKPTGDHIHLTCAAGLKYILGGIKKEPEDVQKQNILLQIAQSFTKYGMSALIKIDNNTCKAKPHIIIPIATEPFWDHCGDTFREMVDLWGELGYVTIEKRKDTPYCWWGGIGEVLLYDRPTPRWWKNPLPSYKMALFGNCPPPGPGAHILKQSIWSFWGRHPKLIEDIENKHTNCKSYYERTIKSIFLGKVENGVQRKNRTMADWSSCIELFSMPDNSLTGVYPFTSTQYLEKLCLSRFGLCLPGFGAKCNREIEYFACGCVPIITPGVDITGYLVPPIESIHYLVANKPEDVEHIITSITPEKWREMSLACIEWWRANASAEGLFKLTASRIAQCEPYLTVGIPKHFI